MQEEKTYTIKMRANQSVGNWFFFKDQTYTDIPQSCLEKIAHYQIIEPEDPDNQDPDSLDSTDEVPSLEWPADKLEAYAVTAGVDITRYNTKIELLDAIKAVVKPEIAAEMEAADRRIFHDYLTKQSKDQLVKYAIAKDIRISDNATKKEIIDAIQAAQKEADRPL